MGEDILEQKKKELATTEKALADARAAKKKREDKESQELEKPSDTQPVLPDDTMPAKTTTTDLNEKQKNSDIKEIFIERGKMKEDLLTHFDLDGLKMELERKEKVLSNLQEQEKGLKPGLVGHISIIKDVIAELEKSKIEQQKVISTPVVSGYSYADGGTPEKPPVVPETAPVATAEDKAKETLAELKRTLRETIENAKKELAEIQRELKEIDARELTRKIAEEARGKKPEEEKEKAEIFSNTEIEEALKLQLLTINYKGIKVSEVKKVNVSGNGEKMVLKSEAMVEFREKNYPAKITLIIKSTGEGLIIEDNTVDAGLVLKATIKGGITLGKNKITDGIKIYFEKVKSKKVKKIWIEDGRLKAL